MKNVKNHRHSYVYILGNVTGDLALCIKKVPFGNYAAYLWKFLHLDPQRFFSTCCLKCF